MVYYRELRCVYCKKLLAKGSGSVQIKCSRCKTVNTFSQTTITESAVEYRFKTDFRTPAGVSESK